MRIAGDADLARDFIKGLFPTAFDLVEADSSAQQIANLELILKGYRNAALGNRCVLDRNDAVLITGVGNFVIRKSCTE